jgi:hypothetical protein
MTSAGGASAFTPTHRTSYAKEPAETSEMRIVRIRL